MTVLKFRDMIFSRDSEAWCPITGNHVLNDIPRIVKNYILEHLAEPRIYYKFPVTQGYTAYSPSGHTRPGETTDYVVDLMNTFESNVPDAERLSLGTSYEGRPLEAFRLGPVNRKHFIVSCVVHGNETDGLAGSFKGMEILMTNQDFSALRSEFTIFFMPCCNPDGHFNYTRDLSKYGPNPNGTNQRINLNRVWPWFWTEYVPTADESKGSVPLDCPEALAIYNYFTTGNSGGPIAVGFLLDQHATSGDGERYQSRDRCFRDVEENDWKSIWAEWIIYRQVRGMQAKRVFEDGMPDLYVNYFRSSWVPHFHAWVSTLTKEANGGIVPISMVAEYNKVYGIMATTDKETYQSACNYTLDYVVGCGMIMQSDSVQLRDAVLIEHEIGNNQFLNSEFEQWQEKSLISDPVDYRPGYWSANRCILQENNFRDKHMKYSGSDITIAPNLIVELSDGYNVGPDGYHDVLRDASLSYKTYTLSNIDSGGIALWSFDQSSTVGDFSNLFIDKTMPKHAYRLLDCSTNYYIADLGFAPSSPLTLFKYTTLGVKSSVAIYSSPRINAAVAKTFNSKAYIIGGDDGTGTLTKKVLVADTSLETITELGTDLMPTADSNAEAEYCVNGTLNGKIVVVGGKTVDPGGIRIVIIDPISPSATETILSVSGTTLPGSLIYHAISYDGIDSIWVYGGESTTGNYIYNGVWKLKYNGTWSITAKNILSGIDNDGDKVDYSGTAYWSSHWSRWKTVRIKSFDDGLDAVMLLGGRNSFDGYDGYLIKKYNSFYIHDINDGIMNLSQDSTFGYIRYNSSISNNDLVSTSWSLKAAASATTAYTRINNATGDSIDNIITVRRARTYYMHPPKWWYRTSGSLDVKSGRADSKEDQFRVYLRTYRDSQSVYVDSPMVQYGTLWPSSWSPNGTVRATESAIWEDCVDPRWMRVKFVWQPQAPFMASRSDINLIRISDGINYLELRTSSNHIYEERCYVNDYSYGPAEPYLELIGSDPNILGCRIPVYWGAQPKDTAMEPFASPLTIEIWQHPDVGTGFSVKNGSGTGKYACAYTFDPNVWSNLADIELLGGGWWSEPENILLTKEYAIENAHKISYIHGRRENYVNDIFNDTYQRRALLIGDCDPTYGKVDGTGTFRYVETFDRSDSSNLGSYWDIMYQTGNGWDISSNKARCTSVGWEEWQAFPNIAFFDAVADVKVNSLNSRVGIFIGLDHSMAQDGYLDGYLGSLYIDGSGDSYVQIEKFEMIGSIQNRTTLASFKLYEQVLGIDFQLDVYFDISMSTYTLYLGYLYSGIGGSISVVLDKIRRPGSIGICGETPNSSSSVEINEIYATTSEVTIKIIG